MDDWQDVSLDVSSKVSLEVARADSAMAPPPPPAAEAPALQANREEERSAPGRYLVRSGSVYLFQIRMPREPAGERCRTVRLSLGPLTAREARRQADLLGALARNRFEQLRVQRMERQPGENDCDDHLLFDGGTPEMTAAEIKGYLKAMQQVIAQPAPPTPPHQVPVFAGLKGLVEINRELAKGSAGNPLIVDNAEMLKAQSIARITGEATSTPGEAPGQKRPAAPMRPDPSPAAVPSPEEKAHDAEGGTDAPRPSAGTDVSSGGVRVPAFKLDRRHVPRKASDKPLFSEVAEEYFAEREAASGEKNKDIGTARFRANLFVELIGDHPIDTYTAADLQAFIYLLTHWPASTKDRPAGKSAREILADNADLTAKPLTLNALRNGYVAIVKSIVNSRTAAYEYDYPLTSSAGVVFPCRASRRPECNCGRSLRQLTPYPGGNETPPWDAKRR
ncbi:MAG: hypothetical protein ACK4F5_14135 [Aliihoeflea sp.]